MINNPKRFFNFHDDVAINGAAKLELTPVGKALAKAATDKLNKKGAELLGQAPLKKKAKIAIIDVPGIWNPLVKAKKTVQPQLFFQPPKPGAAQ